MPTLGLEVHKKIKDMTKAYGLMLAGVPAETLGQNQAEISSASIKKMGDIRENIDEAVRMSDFTQPSNSCGQASNDVCMLLLGIEGSDEFEKSSYECLSSDGSNLKSVLPNEDLLIRVEVDRYNPPKTYSKIKRAEFNPAKAEAHKVYLLEDQLLYLNESRQIIDLGQTPENCKRLFDAIQTPYLQDYVLNDDFMDPPSGPEEEAVCEMDRALQDSIENINCWCSTHSFTIFAPQTEEESPRGLYPYQAYWTKHTLQQWFSGDKDEKLSQLGIDAYIEKLALLGETTNSKVRSDTYAELFSTPGSESTFCATIREKTSPLRVKYKVTEVRPEHALENLESVMDFIDQNYPGENAKRQWELYDKTARSAMKQNLEALLIPPKIQELAVTAPITERNQVQYYRQQLKENAISSLITEDDLKTIIQMADSVSTDKREQLVEFLKTLPEEKLDEHRHKSNTVQEVWDELYGSTVPKHG